MSKPRLNLVLEESQMIDWMNASEREKRKLPEWVKIVLDAVATAGVTTFELEEILREKAKK